MSKCQWYNYLLAWCHMMNYKMMYIGTLQEKAAMIGLSFLPSTLLGLQSVMLIQETVLWKRASCTWIVWAGSGSVWEVDCWTLSAVGCFFTKKNLVINNCCSYPPTFLCTDWKLNNASCDVEESFHRGIIFRN